MLPEASLKSDQPWPPAPPQLCVAISIQFACAPVLNHASTLTAELENPVGEASGMLLGASVNLAEPSLFAVTRSGCPRRIPVPAATPSFPCPLASVKLPEA